MLTKIDELNRPEYEAISYDEYFAPMDIPEEDKGKRVEMAEEIDDIYYNFFAMIATMVATQQYLDWDYLNDYLNTRLYDTFENYEYSSTRDYLQRYADLTASNTVTTTLDHQGEEYYLSDERASRLAAENAQTIANYTELQDAILAGFTHKTWKAELDKKTRKDHREKNGKTISITGYFKFPDCEMLMPHDEINGSARQCANCRCSLSYTTRENTLEDSIKDDIISNRKTLNRARTINAVEDLESVSSSKVIGLNGIEEIKKHFSDNYGISVEGFDEKELFDVKATLSGFDDMLTEFPEIVGHIKAIKYDGSFRDMGEWSSSGNIRVGKSGLKDYGTGVHEASHALDHLRGTRKEPYCEKICEVARKNLHMRKNGREYKNSVRQITGSPKDAKKPAEIYAYAMETAKGGVDNALAKEIYRLTKEGL